MQEQTQNTMELLPLETVQPAIVDQFDAMAVGEKLAKETAVFEFHASRPGFRKPIRSAEFIRKIKAAGEQAMTPEQASKLAQYQATITTTQGPNGEVTDTTMLHVSQDILSRKEITAIAYHDGRFWNWLKTLSVPSPMLAPGMYQITLPRVEQLEAALGAFAGKRLVLIEAFKNKYLELKEEAKQRRWPFYNEADYPEWADIEAKYTVEARWLTFNVPAALERINSKLYEEQKQKAKIQWADAAQELRDGQRALFQELLDNFVEMLGKDEVTGKRKTFRPTAYKKLIEFCDMAKEFNITGDVGLDDMIEKTKAVASGVDVTSMRKDVSLRDTMLTAATKLKEQAAHLIVVRERKVVFEDEPEDDDEEGEALPLDG